MRSLKKRGPHVLDDLMTSYFPYSRNVVFWPYLTISYHIVDLKRQNRLKVGTDKPNLKVKMQYVHGLVPREDDWTFTS